MSKRRTWEVLHDGTEEMVAEEGCITDARECRGAQNAGKEAQKVLRSAWYMKGGRIVMYVASVLHTLDSQFWDRHRHDIIKIYR